MKYLFLVTILVGCGTTHVKAPKVVVDDSTDTSTGTDTGTDTTTNGTSPGDPNGIGTANTPSAQLPDNTVQALSFTNDLPLKGVRQIFSATKIINELYFTGLDDGGIPILGKVKPDGSNLTITPFGKLSTEAVHLNNDRYSVISNTDDRLFISDSASIAEIDLLSMTVKTDYTSRCSGTNTFEQNGRWVRISFSRSTICGIEDGQVIQDQQTIMNDYTGQPLQLDNYSLFSSDGVHNYQYNYDVKVLTFYTTAWAPQVSYSASAYKYSGAFVGDSEGNRWMLGCSSSQNCYITDVSVVSQ